MMDLERLLQKIQAEKATIKKINLSEQYDMNKVPEIGSIA